MKISYNWIKKYLTIPKNLNEIKIANILTEIGITVNNILCYEKNKKKKDYIFEIEIPVNRSDIVSHYGIARDLYSVLKFRKFPDVNLIKLKTNNSCYNNKDKEISIFLDKKNEKEKNVIRYSGFSIFQMKIEKSPTWLVNRLESLEIKSINNILDIINFVIYELGIPIHIFDINKIKGKKIIIKKIGNNFDNKNSEIIDLIIYDEEKKLSIGGGIVDKSKSDFKNVIGEKKNIFLGAICINHNIGTILKKKYSFNKKINLFFGKKVDPNQTFFALKRLSFLIKKISNNKYISKIIDIYPFILNPTIIKIQYSKIHKIIGKNISINVIKKILISSNINIKLEKNDHMVISIPTYRTDIKKEIDVIEEILRIYGINNVNVSKNIKIPYKINRNFDQEKEKIKKNITEQLINHGFYEIISNSIINNNNDEINFFEKESDINTISIINPISKNHNKMRTSLLYGITDCIIYNFNHNKTIIDYIKLFEIGKIYFEKRKKFLEKTVLGLSIAVKKKLTNKNTFLFFKGIIEQILRKKRIYNYVQEHFYHPCLEYGLSISINKKKLAFLGKIKRDPTKKVNFFYSEINLEYFISIILNNKKNIQYEILSKYPFIKKDLSFFIRKNIPFEKINRTFYFIKKKNKLIQNIKIYDIKDDILESKISYTASFIFGSKEKTLKNEAIKKIIKNIEIILKNELKAKIRDKNLTNKR